MEVRCEDVMKNRLSLDTKGVGRDKAGTFNFELTCSQIKVSELNATNEPGKSLSRNLNTEFEFECRMPNAAFELTFW